MKYILKKKWHPSQVEEVGHVFKGNENFDSKGALIALLVDAGYLEKQTEEPTIDLWTTEPPKGTEYWFSRTFKGKVETVSYAWEGDEGDMYNLKTNNCHRTQQSAKEALKRLLA